MRWVVAVDLAVAMEWKVVIEWHVYRLGGVYGIEGGIMGVPTIDWELVIYR